MIPDTVSALEVVRALVALFGLTVSWRGRILSREQRAAISADDTDDPHVRRERELRDDRMLLFERAQTAFCGVHLLLLANAVVNMGYPSAPIEQPNVLLSNVTQVMIPLMLARVSEFISIQMRTALRLHTVTGPRDRGNGGDA